jgi:AraC-like DNA-binding protein
MSSRLPSIYLGPGDLPNEEQFHYWRRGIEAYFDTHPLVDPRDPPVVPEVRQHHVGSFLFIETRASAQKYLREADWMRRHDDTDHILIQAYLQGRNRVSNGGRYFVQTPGTVSVVDLGREVEAVSEAAEVLSLVLPRRVLADRLPGLLTASGLLATPGSAASRMLCGFLQSMRDTLPDATQEDAPMLADALFGLLSGVVGTGDLNARDAVSGTFAALQRYIDSHLGDPDLTVPRLCKAFNLSRPTLYRLFRSEGGVQSYIQRRRLMACFRALSAPQHMHRRIYEVALDFTLENPSHVTALFRQHFGMSPSEVREAARHRVAMGQWADVSVAAPGGSDVERMQQWAQELGRSPAKRDRPDEGVALRSAAV